MGISLSFEVKFILLALAVYRASELVTQDRGPFDIFLNLRIWLGAYDRDETGEPRTELGRLVECAYCTGIWLSLPALLLLAFIPFVLEGIGVLWLGVVWLALAGLQSLFETVAGRANARTMTLALDDETRAAVQQIAERTGE